MRVKRLQLPLSLTTAKSWELYQYDKNGEIVPKNKKINSRSLALQVLPSLPFRCYGSDRKAPQIASRGAALGNVLPLIFPFEAGAIGWTVRRRNGRYVSLSCGGKKAACRTNTPKYVTSLATKTFWCASVRETRTPWRCYTPSPRRQRVRSRSMPELLHCIRRRLTLLTHFRAVRVVILLGFGDVGISAISTCGSTARRVTGEEKTSMVVVAT